MNIILPLTLVGLPLTLVGLPIDIICVIAENLKVSAIALLARTSRYMRYISLSYIKKYHEVIVFFLTCNIYEYNTFEYIWFEKAARSGPISVLDHISSRWLITNDMLNMGFRQALNGYKYDNIKWFIDHGISNTLDSRILKVFTHGSIKLMPLLFPLIFDEPNKSINTRYALAGIKRRISLQIMYHTLLSCDYEKINYVYNFLETKSILNAQYNDDHQLLRLSVRELTTIYSKYCLKGDIKIIHWLEKHFNILNIRHISFLLFQNICMAGYLDVAKHLYEKIATLYKQQICISPDLYPQLPPAIHDWLTSISYPHLPIPPFVFENMKK